MNKIMTKTKKSMKHTNKTSSKLSIRKKIISKPTTIILAALTLVTIGFCAFAVINKSYATSPFGSDVPITSTAEAEVSNVIVEASAGNTIRVQFDYNLANGAVYAVVDAALLGQRSFGQTEVTGPGHYDQTITGAADGTYYIAIMISGNPTYVLGDPGPANQPLIITLPITNKSNGGRNIWRTEQYFHMQKQYFQ
ncbi:hypothetical protein EPN95_04335 [Patescibacteria group bacterium]|nr:MAG: hypothetical protein EPN95_04335 [Patescibacteria group bacterium]